MCLSKKILLSEK